jgi:hypothetical protein
MEDEPKNGSTAADETSRPSMWGLLLPIYFLLLLFCGIGLIIRGDADPPDRAFNIYGVVLVISIAGLFMRRRMFGFAIDRRNYMPRALLQWFWFGFRR